MGIADEIDRVLRGVRALGNDVEPPPRAEPPAPENGVEPPSHAGGEPPPREEDAGQAEAVADPDIGTAPAADEDDAGGPADETTTTPPPDSAPASIVAGLHDRDEQALRRLETVAFVSESLGLGYHLGGAIERIAAGASGGSGGVGALREATWLVERYIAIVEGRPLGADLHACTVRLGRTGELIAELRALSASLDARPHEPPAEPVAAPAPTPDLEPAPVAEPAAAAYAETAPAPAPPVVPATPAAPDPLPAPPARDPLWREIALIAVRWAIMVAAVALAVLAVTLIGQWR